MYPNAGMYQTGTNSIFIHLAGLELLGEIVIFIVALVVAFMVNKRAQAAHPLRQSFVWGYFQTLELLINVVFGALLGLIMASQMMGAFAAPEVVMIVVFGVPLFILGLLAFKRNRIALVIMTVISSNPVLWIINFFYLKNRWEEMNTNAGAAQDTAAVAPATE